MKQISLISIFQRYRLRILGTWSLVVAEAALMLLFPLLMGMAIDDLLQQKYLGLYLLGGAGLLTNAVGAARRFYDTRLYSQIYATTSEQIVSQERQRNADVSVIAARTNMANEFVEFMENSLPAIMDAAIALVGTLVMIWFLQINVFFGCVVATVLIVTLYGITSQKTYQLNQGFNDESERRVSILTSNDSHQVTQHFRNMVRWNIRLSDLETVNFAASWIVMISVLLFAIVATVQSGITAQGKVLSILMYVFSYIESVIAIPLFYQQFVRLQEISHRLEGDDQT